MTDPTRPNLREPAATPRWVQVFGIIAAVLVVLVVAIMIFGGGQHGPGRHTSSDGAGGHAALSSARDAVSAGDR